jgi:hypothetical protein
MLKIFPQTQPNRNCTRLDQNSATSFSDRFDHGKEPQKEIVPGAEGRIPDKNSMDKYAGMIPNQ